MKVDLLQPEVWENLNGKLKKHKNISDEASVRIYRGLAHAVLEIVQGTALFLSHKRSVVWIKGQTYAYDSVLPFLYKEAYDVQAFLPEQIFDNKAWVSSLKKDTNFILLCEDHPVTGELFNWQEVDELCQEKRIFCIRVSHSNHFYDKQEVKPYSVRICSQTPQYAYAVCGEKFKSPTLLAPAMYWSAEEIEQNLLIDHQASSGQSQVLDFEKNLPKGFKNFFLTSAPRIYDRAVFYHESLSGDAIQKNLAKLLSTSLQLPGWEIQIETTNLCRWNSTINFYDWWLPKPADNVLQGMLVLHHKLIGEKGFMIYLQKAAQSSSFTL